MWLKKANARTKENAPEKLRYSRYYEHDGALRAYANRAMAISLLCVPTTLLAVGLAAYLRVQPPTIVRVDASGTANVIGAKSPSARSLQVVSAAADAEPNEFEKRAYVELFLKRYLNFSYESVDRSWADALNMMTTNLRRTTLLRIQKSDVIGDVKSGQVTSVFHLRSLEPAVDDPLSFTAYGVKDVHRLRDQEEETDKLVGEFHIRLTTERRSEENPNGLLVAEYGEQLIEGERRDAVPRDSEFKTSH